MSSTLTRAAACALLLLPAALTFGQRPWSDPAGWPGGRLPVAGDQVVIAPGDDVLLDVSPPSLRSLRIQGSLRFDRRDLLLRSGWILVDGLLEVGTAAEPFAHSATIELDGPVEDAMGMGGRFLAVATGSLELHGASAAKRTWTQLAASVDSGATQLTLAEATDWVVGDELGIAPSGFDAYAVDRVTVTAIEGRTVTFTPALRHGHFGEVLAYGGKDIDCRAEVALLSREISIQGPATAEAERYGGHIMIMGGAGAIHVEGVRLHRLGQPGREARYSFHWHLAGDRAGDYVRRSSVVGALQRGVVVHGTQNVEVSDNVVFDVHNHAYIPAEDGDETGNRFIGNLAVFIQKPERTEFAFPRDNAGGSNQGEHRSSGFWLRNFDNVLVNNHVGGVEDGCGFFYDAAFRGRDFRFAEDDMTEPVTFTGNLAHSMMVTKINNNAGSNTAMYGQVGLGMGIFIDKFGIDDEQEDLFRFTDFTAYKCDMSAVWSEISEAHFEDLALADNATAFLTGPGSIHDAVVVGRSRNPVGADNRKLRHGNDRAGYYTVAQGGEKRPRFSSVRYFNMHEGKDNEAAGMIVDYSLSYNPNYSRDVSLDNSRPVWMEDSGAKGKEPSGAALFDADGTLTGTGEPTLVLFRTSPLVRDDCTWHPEWNGYTCPSGDYLDLTFRWSDGRTGVKLVQADGSSVKGGGSAPARARMHVGEEVEAVFGKQLESHHTFDLEVAPHAASPGGAGLVRIPYPYPGVAVTTADGEPVPRLASEQAVRAADGPAFAFDGVNGNILFRAVAPPSDQATYRFSAGDQAVTALPDHGDTAEDHEAVQTLGLYPNPYTPATVLTVRVREEGEYGLTVTDVTGRHVAEVFTAPLQAGTHTLPVSLPDLPSGVYHLTLAGAAGSQTRAIHVQ